MDTSFLGTEEPVLITAGKIIIGGIRHEAALTGQRFLLADESGTIVRNIPLSSISTVSVGSNALREPLLHLTLTEPGGETAAVDLIFARSAGGLNTRDRDRFFEILGTHGVGQSIGWIAPVSEPLPRQQAQEWAPSPFLKKDRQPAPGVPEGRSPEITIIAIVLIIAVIIGIAFTFPQFSAPGKPVEPPVTPSPVITPALPTPGTTIVPSASLLPTQVPTTVSADPSAPESGVWVRIRYPGNYTGTVGAKGYVLDVNATGTRFFRIPVASGIIEGSVGKSDSSGNTLDISIYHDGVLVFRRETGSPGGVIDFHVPLPLPGEVISPTLAPVTLITTPPPPEISLPDIAIPPNGTWVRVHYPGNVTGAIGSSGVFQDVSTSGDHLYQLSIVGGMIEGSVQKQDGSGNPLVVAIYRDGLLVSRLFTFAPHGTIDIHVPLV